MRCLRFLLPCLFGCLTFFTVPSPSAVFAQQQQAPAFPQPRLFIAAPCGGQAGMSVEVTLTGQDLEDPQSLLFSHPNIKAELLKAPPQPKPDPAMTGRRGQAQGSSAVKFKVTIPADVPLGHHDVRVVNKWGVSNPRTFVVGDLAEVLEKEPNNDVGEAQRVALNTTIHGAISAPTDVDYFVFAGTKGQRVVVSCLASSIDSRLPAGLQLFDRAGRSLAFSRNYQGNDALVDYTLPDDGDYLVRLFAFTYTQGTPEHFYRLTISTTPWIDAVYPSVVEPGKTAKLTIYGRNLPQGQPDSTMSVDGRPLEKVSVTLDVPNEPKALQRLAFHGYVPPRSSSLDGFAYRLKNDVGASNAVLLTYAQAPVVLDNEANDTPETAQVVTWPCEIFGRIEKKHDRDWYVFPAKKGEVFSIEAFGDRLGSQLDLYFTLRNAETKQMLGEFDDSTEVLNPVQFFTRTEDPARQRFVAPADGHYQLQVASREADVQSGPRDQYRVRITPERPDFRLIVMPAGANGPDACVVRQGSQQYYTVFAWRLDGWNGPISLTATGLPEGVTCPPQLIGAGLRQATLVVSAAKDAKLWTGMIQVSGTAEIDGQSVVREARPATITWPLGQQQQNVATISRLDHSLVLAVRDQAPFHLTAELDKAQAMPGEKVTVKIKLERRWADFKAPLQVTVLNLPPNLSAGNNNQPITINEKNEGSIVLDVKANVQPGTYTLVLRGQAQHSYARDAQAKQKANVTLAQPSNPLTLTVLTKELAKLSVEPETPKVKIGKQTKLTIKVARSNDFTGEFKVHLVLPSKVKGLSAEDVTIPAGKTEATLVLAVADDASPGSRDELIVRATAKVKGQPALTQEKKFSVNVVK